jgi:carbamoyltransferase
MIILGLSLSVDSHAVLFIDGEMKSAIGEERLSRIKGHTGFPEKAIQEVLKIENISPSEIEAVAVGSQGYLKMVHRTDIETFMYGNGILDYANEKPWWYRKKKLRDVLTMDLKRGLKLSYTPFTLEKYFKQKLLKMGVTANIHSIDHHLSHALSAYYFSGKEHCLVITADGFGDGLSGGVYTGIDGAIKKLYSTDSIHSVGNLYAAATKYLGYKRHRHEGKLTGLAAYGNPEKLLQHLNAIVKITDDKSSFQFDLDKLKYPKSSIQHRFRYYRHMLRGSYLPGELTPYLLKYFQRHFSNEKPADVAAAVQKIYENFYIEHVRAMIKKTKLTDLAIAGGNFANVLLNQKLLEETGATSIFVHPNMGDGGTAIGAAISVYMQEIERQNRKYIPHQLAHVYLGPDINAEELPAITQEKGLLLQTPTDPEKKVAELLAEGFIVGRINGKMEYGPRALGNRSILAHPFDASINQDLNRRLSRTEFMPFAPSVLADKAHKYYEGANKVKYTAQFMTITLTVKKEGEIAAAVTHVDNTARPHFVEKNANPSYYRIIEEFEKITGIPIIINTSFNQHEEPIVCKLEEGIARLLDDSIQYLSVGKYLVRKNSKPTPFQTLNELNG